MSQDPKLWETIAQAAQQAIAAGRDPGEVNAMIQEDTGLPNLPALLTKLRGGATTQETLNAEPEASGVDPLTKALAVGARGVSAGFAGDILEALPGGEGLRAGYEHAVDAAREENPVAAGVGELATALVPGLGMGKGILAGGKLAANAAARVAGRKAGSRLFGRTAGGAVGGAATGAAEGGLFGAGQVRAEGGTWEEALKGAGSGALLGTVVGAGAGGGVGAWGARNELKDQIREAGPRIRNEIQQQVETIPGMRNTLETLGGLKNDAYRNALQGDVATPVAAHVAAKPVMRDALRASGRQGKEFLRRWDAHLRNARAGRPTTAPPLPAVVFNDLREQLRRRAVSFRKSPVGSDPRIGEGDVRLAEEALADLDQFTSQLPGFDTAQDLARLQGTQKRALDAGKKAWSAPAEEVVDDFARLGTPEEQMAYRAGLARKLTQKLGGTQADVKTQLRKLLEGDEGQRKARILFGSDEAFADFMDTIEQAQGNLNADRIAAEIAKYLSFTLFGSSVLAGAAAVN